MEDFVITWELCVNISCQIQSYKVHLQKEIYKYLNGEKLPF
jgi:hypothetical protein